MDGKVVKPFQLGYVPGAFLKKYEDGDQGFLSSVDLKEMLVCVVGHVGGCLDIFILLPPSSQVPWVCVIYCIWGGAGYIEVYSPNGLFYR